MPKQMKLLGFNLTKITVDRSMNYNGKIDIKSDLSIKSVEKEKVELIKEESMRVHFDFIVTYGELGKLEMSGFLIVLLDEKLIKDCLKQWKEKKLPDEVRLPILNIILQKCSLRALQLEEEMGLPLHIPLPYFKKSEQQ